MRGLYNHAAACCPSLLPVLLTGLVRGWGLSLETNSLPQSVLFVSWFVPPPPHPVALSPYAPVCSSIFAFL